MHTENVHSVQPHTLEHCDFISNTQPVQASASVCVYDLILQDVASTSIT